MKQKINYLVAVLCIFGQSLLSFGQGKNTQRSIEDSIREAWKERSDKVDSFDCTCSLTRTDSADAATTLFSDQKPDGPVELKQAFTFIKKGKMLWMESKGEEWNNDSQSHMHQVYTRCFDGKMNKALLVGNAYRFPAAQINNDPKPAEELTNNTHYTPLWLSFSADEMLNRRNFKTFAMSATGKRCECQGRPCLELTLLRDGVNSYIYVDAERAFLPVKFVEMRGPKDASSELEIQYVESDTVSWVLRSWISKFYNSNGKVKTVLRGRVEHVTVNGPINDSVFDIHFPARTRIREISNGVTRFYIQQADGKRQEIIRGGT